MRLYNGKNSLIDLPLTNKVRLTIPAHSVSKEFMPSDDFLNMLVTAYKDTDIALIVSGPYELNMCAKNPVISPMIAYTLDEAVIRFNGEPERVVEREEKEETTSEPEVERESPTKVEEGEPDCAVEGQDKEAPKKKKHNKKH